MPEISDARGDQRSTALILAAEAGHVDVVRLLLERGANPKRRNQQGQTARELAERGGWKEVLLALDERGRSERGLLDLF